MADRLGVRGGFATVTNIMVGLWSSEVMHAIRIRRATFRAVCPDAATSFASWWSGRVPPPGPPTSTFVLLDPTVASDARRALWVDLDLALDRATRPRSRGYADAAAATGQRL
jgi:hypothetical protein